MLCIYHLADHDGKGSAAIVKSIYPETEFFGLNHGMEIPYHEIEKHDRVVVCDISLPMDYMFELNDKIELIWIDHHISVIEKYDAAVAKGAKPIKGLRRLGTAAIQLTWEYFYPDKPVPLGIELLAKNDIFDLTDKRVRPFEYAIQAVGVNDPQDEIWQDLLSGKVDVEEMVKGGERILSWIKLRNYSFVRFMAFESEIDGHKCICANMARGYSEFFDSVEHLEKYDIMVNFYMNKDNLWNLTFYSSKENVDVSKIAAKFGGGGHKAAAGASNLSELPAFLLKHL